MGRWRTMLWAMLAAASGGGAAAAEAPARPVVEFETTLGAIAFELWPGKAPATVANFLQLVDDGFHAGTIFHRVIAGFMVQAGGYDATMTLRQAPRQVPNESANGERNRRWTVAMARHADPDSAGAQFYLNMADNAHLDTTPGQPGYTVFGRLVAGHAVAERIESAETGTAAGMPNVPKTPIVILAARRLAGAAAGSGP